ncbi:MAG: phosphate ABC transporter permease PstA [Candidatus Limnocylindrales bacterium]
MNTSTDLFAAGAKRRQRRRQLTNRIMLGLAAAAAVVAIIPLVWIIAYVFVQGIQAISLDFFTSLPTPVGVPGGGIANAIVGSLITVGLGLVLAAPVGLLVGIYASARPRSRSGIAIRFLTDTVAGVPSIVMGIFAYTIVVLPMGHFSALAGAVVLAFIMVPIIIRSTEEMLKLVPGTLREGSLALGAPEWRTTWRVLLPAALSGIVTGLMLAIARAAGEAAPMLFTAFGNPFMSTNLDQPIATLPHTIYVYAISPYPDWQAKAWGTALVLIVLVLVLNIAARSIVGWRARAMGGVR